MALAIKPPTSATIHTKYCAPPALAPASSAVWVMGLLKLKARFNMQEKMPLKMQMSNPTVKLPFCPASLCAALEASRFLPAIPTSVTPAIRLENQFWRADYQGNERAERCRDANQHRNAHGQPHAIDAQPGKHRTNTPPGSIEKNQLQVSTWRCTESLHQMRHCQRGQNHRHDHKGKQRID